MIKATIKGEEYNVPTTWADVPFCKAVQILKLKEPDEVLCALIGLDAEVLGTLETKSVATLFNCIRFIEDIELMNDETPLEKYASFDYGSAPYGDTEGVKIIMNRDTTKNFMDLAPDVIKKLTGDDISEEPFDKIVGTVGFFLNQWIASCQDMKNLEAMKEAKSNNSQESNGSKGLEALVLG